MLNEIPTQSGQSSAVRSSQYGPASRVRNTYPVPDRPMRITSLALLSLSILVATPARADLHITRDHGGYVEEYKVKYKRIDRKSVV